MKGISQIKDKIEKSIFNIVVYLTLIIFSQTILYYFSNILDSLILQRFLVVLNLISVNILLLTSSLIIIDFVKKYKK